MREEAADTQLSIEVLLSNLVGLFLLIGVGYGMVRGGLVPLSSTGALTSLLLKVALPATIFTSMIRPFDPSFVRDAVIIVVVSTVLFFLYAAVSAGLVKVFKVPKGRQGVWMLAATFCNNGFMGFPVAYALFGDEGLALAVMLGIPFNILMYSLGATQVSLDRCAGGEKTRLTVKQVLFSAVNGAILLGLIFYAAQIPVPEVIFTPLQHLSNITTPLSMLITGMSLAASPLPSLFRDRDAITCVVTRLILLPLLTWVLLLLLPIPNPLITSVILIIMSMPSAAVVTAMAQRYESDRELAARMVCLSSLLCMVTLPLIALLL